MYVRTKVSPDWICAVMSRFTKQKLFYCERLNIAHILSGTTLKDFVRDCLDSFVAQICAKMCVRAGIRAYLRDDAGNVRICQFMHSIFRFFDDI